MDVYRYYGKTYSDSLIGELTKLNNSVGSSPYSTPINKLSVGSNSQTLYDGCLSVAQDAYSSVDKAKEQIERLALIIQTYYEETDETSRTIIDITSDIMSIISESNSALSNLCNALQGVGVYSAKVVSPSTLTDVGFDSEKCKQYRSSALGKILDLGLANGNKKISNVAITDYVDSIRKKFENDSNYVLTDEERKKLTQIYDYYVDLRFGDTKDIRDLPMQDIQNLVDIYEMLNPTAKEITDDFFWEVLLDADEVTRRNVLRVKYTIYTADPEYRDLIIENMPEIAMTKLATDGNKYSYFGNILYVDLDKDFDVKDPVTGLYVNNRPMGGFFHELGHFMDDVLVPNGFASEGLRDELEKDLITSIDKILEENGIKLTEGEREEFIDFLFSADNVNISYDENDEISTTKILLQNDYGWSDAQVEAYIKLREHYECRMYFINPDGSVETKDHWEDNYGSTYYYGILGDILGGLTKNKIGGSGHAWTLKDGYTAKDAWDLRVDLAGYDYWQESFFSDNVEQEFFAEMFEYNLMEINQTPTRDVFKTAGEEFDATIKNY